MTNKTFIRKNGANVKVVERWPPATVPEVGFGLQAIVAQDDMRNKRVQATHNHLNRRAIGDDHVCNIEIRNPLPGGASL